MESSPQPTPLSAFDIENIERATLAAVSPLAVEALPAQALGEWLLPFDHSTIGRAKSAVPLAHNLAAATQKNAHGLDLPNNHSITEFIRQVESRYRAQGLPTLFRLADAPGLGPLCVQLTALGYTAQQPTLVQIGSASHLARLGKTWPIQVTRRPHHDWATVYLAQGFDAADGASRVTSLSRAQDGAYASLRRPRDPCRDLPLSHSDTGAETAPVAAGVASFSHGWASIHGMRTVNSHRGQGLAQCILAGLAKEALARGLERVFLQVEADNTAAIALYHRMGFTTAWRYHYWRPEAEPRAGH